MHKVLVSLLTVTALVLAGCSDEPAQPKNTDIPTPEEGMGVLHGVVVDSAIRPLPGATVEAVGPNAEALAAQSDADGRFIFVDVEPGSYIVKASKLGYFPSQSSTTVVADEMDPAAVRILLELNPETRPYFTQHVFDGYVDCSLNFLQACGLVDVLAEEATGAPVTNDAMQVRYELDRVPTWIQSEMVWESTQDLGNRLNLAYSYGTCDEVYLCDHEVQGESPLTLTANETMAQTLWDEAAYEETPLFIRVFPGSTDGTKQCVPDVGCFNGLGGALEQDYRIITHIFYGYTPPEGWTFVNDGPPALPQ